MEMQLFMMILRIMMIKMIPLILMILQIMRAQFEFRSRLCCNVESNGADKQKEGNWKSDNKQFVHHLG